MKKVIFVLILFLFFATSYAVCRIVDLKTNVSSLEIIHSVNIRNYPCTSQSYVLKVAKKGDIYKVLGKTYGYYKIQLPNQKVAWVWEKMVKPYKMYYSITNKDQLLLSKINRIIEKKVKQKGLNYKNKILSLLNKILAKQKVGSRNYVLIEKIIESTQNIKLEQKTKITSKISFKNKKHIETTKQKVNEEHIEGSEVGEKTQNFKFSKSIVLPETMQIDEKKVKKNWLEWYNNTRKQLGLSSYTYNEKLDKSALAWSLILAQKNVASHKRHSNDGYYDYKQIEKWMKNEGVVCKNIHRYTFTENIGRGIFSCNTNDCTNALINAIKKTYLFYMSEKNKKYKAHYTSIIAKYFRLIGLGIVVKPTNKKNMYKYFLTVHYCTEFK